MPDLIAPDAALHSAWLEAHIEWGPGAHEDGFGLQPSDHVCSESGFAAWVDRLRSASVLDSTGALRSACTYRWIVESGQVLGGIALRHEHNDIVEWAGHIGYGIRPSARGRGLATWALGQMLEAARQSRMDRVLVVCADDNAASAKTIERNGGILEGVRATPLGPARRYWVNIGTGPS
ncbi:GNAT family N-acetyltransferase [Smaragdicoccus niigatensis]|uniref:GNAT family N-acetyltransferase n=1 Tax=Smaragdicoccus niigatensis TaxID=359359 RepID=UPI00037BD515|nr:GNAT family N-acetyltransferase [Smaragdicoccus niigatensis]